ncbi:tyrosine-type recombinase/integrase [Azospirillum agricola]|uniref:tyrosine-type recombinase/integrase n=1 Tax=Azospirillum agricola TaxID=1720247 RepID=UPI000A0EF169|nr:site-specific integrase [Azospirillum agricola]SMH43445.1 Site-specific recombinase XerD [Azospirillum lipoferum]
MAKEKLTKRSVEQFAVKEKDYIVFDSDLPGFGVRVMPSGKRFFLIQYRRHGRTRRVMLGQFGPVTAERARRDATRMLGNVRGADGDPAALRDQERQSTSVQELGERFLKEHVAVRCKPRTQGEYKRAIELFINPFFGTQRTRTVTPADVADLHGTYSHIPYQANRTLGVLSKMMSLAETWGIRDKHTNPCEDIERYPEHKRERFLSAKEIQRLGEVLREAEVAGTESQYAVAAFRLLLLTGCRLSEIQTLKWAYVNLEENELDLPDSKTGAKTVHFGQAVHDLLEKLPRADDNPYVIAGKIEGHYLTDLQKPWRRIRKAAGIEEARIHDLRHTFASGGLLVGEGLPMIGKLLGHTQIQTTARYAHLADDPIKAVATRISSQLAAALG